MLSYPRHPAEIDVPDLDPDVSKRYFDTLMRHIEAVQEAGEKLGVPEDQLRVHDLSKFSPVEYQGYALHFQGGGMPALFSFAWLHHIHHNPHHWQHWMFPDNFRIDYWGVEPGGVLIMPQRYALKMVADWMGASYVYTGSWDMSDWLGRNLGKISLHSNTRRYVREVLETAGYGALIATLRFANEKTE